MILLYFINMRKQLSITAFLLFFLLIPNLTVKGNQIDYSPSTPLCLPFNSIRETQACATIGPISYLQKQQELGMLLPLIELPASPLADDLSSLPFFYIGLSHDKPIPLYPSAIDALAKTNPYRNIETGFNYATYTDFRIIDGKKTYMIEPGVWVNGNDTTGRIAGSTFSGLTLSGTPENKFGWMIFTSESKRTPGYEISDFYATQHLRYDVIQVYDSVIVNGEQWHLIGPDRWIEARYTALVYPFTEPPVGVENGRWIEINLFEQTIAVYEDNQMVFATLVSSGLPGWWTRPGLFQVTEKLTSTPMSGSFEADRSDYYYLQDVPWTMYYDESRAFHGAYWHNSFGYQRSHGCANLSPADSFWLFDWADVGDNVFVWDPSGVTPVDPSLYGAGGA